MAVTGDRMEMQSVTSSVRDYQSFLKVLFFVHCNYVMYIFLGIDDIYAGKKQVSKRRSQFS